MNKIWSKTKTPILCGACFLLGTSLTLCSPSYKIDKDSASWMPNGASDGCAYHSGSFLLGPPAYYYEFNISEDDFITWMKDQKYDVSEVSTLVEIPRYTSYIYSQNAEIDAGIFENAAITDGLYYEVRKDDRGRYIGYDRMTQRCYHYHHTR